MAQVPADGRVVVGHGGTSRGAAFDELHRSLDPPMPALLEAEIAELLRHRGPIAYGETSDPFRSRRAHLDRRADRARSLSTGAELAAASQY
jgi:hypothetical protein